MIDVLLEPPSSHKSQLTLMPLLAFECKFIKNLKSKEDPNFK